MSKKAPSTGTLDNRERLEIAALDAVRKNGLRSLSFRTLGAEVGIKSSSVHYHFPDKGDLARSLLDRYGAQFHSALVDIADAEGLLQSKLDDFIALFEAAACNDSICLCGMMAAEIDHLSESNRLLLRQYFNDTEAWLVRLFESHQDEIVAGLEPTTLALVLMAGLEGALLLDRAGTEPTHLNAQRLLAASWIRKQGLHG